MASLNIALPTNEMTMLRHYCQETFEEVVKPEPTPSAETKPALKICLDFLKGRCKRRHRCKFAHPELPANPTGEEICQVWALTGYCKFGDQCRYEHPAQSAAKESEEDAASEAGSEIVDDGALSRETSFALEAPAPVRRRLSVPTFTLAGMLPSLTEPVPRKVNGLLNRLSPDNFEALVPQVQALVFPCGPLALTGLLALVFRKAIREPLYGRLYAQLCARVCPANMLTLLPQMCQVSLTECSRDERLGAMKFLGELVNEKIATCADVTKTLELLMERADCSASEEEELHQNGHHLELACSLLANTEQFLEAEKPQLVDFYLFRMQTLSQARPHSPRVRLLVLNAVELHTVQHGVPRPAQREVKPSADSPKVASPPTSWVHNPYASPASPQSAHSFFMPVPQPRAAFFPVNHHQRWRSW
eukprot:NODE_155_length_1765_cov_986.944056_g105_i0.p1 GENE.NODE_155_length_1765_cov_986.944056_g105_i0~~NODE_155_length_1765_cov_986.944056_g105_i0.p1  ORF type:complete len:419 (+),score=167.05 NODE_155_length_1765_cov_986.944056_g105_i0:62-1318(+)